MTSLLLGEVSLYQIGALGKIAKSDEKDHKDE
jgi:hypothetical protein